MFSKLKKNKLNLSELLEHIMAAIVFIAIVIATLSLWQPFSTFLKHSQESGAFLDFLGYVFSIVIGIEFFKLLCNPGKETMLEVLMFVIARHMIIDHTTTLENLLSIAGISLLFIIDKYFLTSVSRHSASETSPEKTLFHKISSKSSFTGDSEFTKEEKVERNNQEEK